MTSYKLLKVNGKKGVYTKKKVQTKVVKWNIQMKNNGGKKEQ